MPSPQTIYILADRLRLKTDINVVNRKHFFRRCIEVEEVHKLRFLQIYLG